MTQQKEIARLEEAIRRFRHWAHIEVNERHIKQARVKQRQIDRMEKIERPVLERRKVWSHSAANSAAANGWWSSGRPLSDLTTPPCSTGST